MLLLTRKPGEKIMVGDHIEITVVAVQGSKVRLGIAAPHGVAIHREEILRKIHEGIASAEDAEKSAGDGAKGEAT